jgi:Heterokaryon incompatibility protein (HET)
MERFKNIEWSGLSKTFQDAILITQVLHIEYLWIDSLCIIQDDKSDWAAES